MKVVHVPHGQLHKGGPGVRIDWGRGGGQARKGEKQEGGKVAIRETSYFIFRLSCFLVDGKITLGNPDASTRFRREVKVTNEVLVLPADTFSITVNGYMRQNLSKVKSSHLYAVKMLLTYIQ